MWRPRDYRPPPRFPERAVRAAQEVPEAAAERLTPARERSATKARPSRPSRADSATRLARPRQPHATTGRGSGGAAPRRPTPPAGSPGSPPRGAPTSRGACDRRLPGGTQVRVDRPLPESAGSSAAPRARSRRAERSAPPRRAPPRSAGHTQARAAQQPTPRRAGAGAGTWLEARCSRHEARGPDGDAARARALPGARAARAGGQGAKAAAGVARSFCFLFSVSFPARRRRKTLIPRQFRFLVVVAPGRKSTLQSVQVVWPVSFLAPQNPQFARGQDGGLR